MTIHQTIKPVHPTQNEVMRQLEWMLSSQHFRITPQQTALLRYVVNQTLAGKSNRIKGYTVATEVFGRRSDFDQNIDPIVSIQAARLRRAMADYFDGAGKHDPLRIEIPKGTYVPKFSLQAGPSDNSAARRQDILPKQSSAWPSVLVQPFQNLSGTPELNFWGVGLATEIAHELNRYPDIRVLTPGVIDSNPQADTGGVRFQIDGKVRSGSSAIKITIQLTDNATGRLIWSESHRSANETAGIIAVQEKIARQVAVKIAGEQGHIARTMASSFKRRPIKEMEVYEAVLFYYAYDLSKAPEAFSIALTALENAVRIDPECGQAWSMLARLYGDIHSYDVAGFPNPLATALEYAHNGVRLSPEDQRARAVLAYIHLLGDDLAAGRAEAEQALWLSPETLFMLDAIGYLLTLLGDWERGPALIRKVIQLNPFYSVYVHHALWVDCLRRGDGAGARDETLKLNQPTSFWDHLARAATAGLLGQIEEGRRAADELLELKPDFYQRGRFLIRNYIKLEAIEEKVVEGLAAVGVEVR